ncbi:MAG: DUF1512 family protein [Thaumarchaeota archaeon]|jgi:hypothetical protein|nr:DUF1512 family protein [Candidatus Terraquivivens yellowstonensis]MCL7392225.1 DUF1512 family protein [Candidatus Terraquivivens yellowstonensis]MCL7397455.1 DUF1512 family protein [Candidatus Terraquivivens yellowstonensis]MCL7399413.1 DUF1512 family protein [Candidatus Terraquivivens yellowstonensis]MCL7400434.1 DUF1512 family protein [Candidatus Terraquivivens yellowstonensis]
MKEGFFLNQLTGLNDTGLGTIVWLIWLALMMLFLFYPTMSQRIQLGYMLRDLERKLARLKLVKDEVRDRTIDAIKRIGKPEKDPTQDIDRLMEFFVIEPESMDPYGIVYKLEHILETGESKFEEEVRKLSPAAEEYKVKTLANLVEVARTTNYLYRIVRHYYLLGKRTANIYLILQLQMLMPQLMEMTEALRLASYAFAYGQPIGDGIGVLAVAKLAYGKEKARYEIAKDTTVSEIEFENRRVLIVRATGPGGTVGRPGEGVKKLIEREGDNVKLIITIDAGLRLEGDESGKMVEGVGVAIGGPGIDKYKIEEIAKERQIPLYAFVIYESIVEAITPMREAIAKAADTVVEKVKSVLLEKVPAGSTAIVAGIGNTVGIG